MAEVKLKIGNGSYRLACRDGDEDDLRAAARYLDDKAKALLETLGTVNESQLLLMAGLQVSGELLARRPQAKPDTPAAAIADEQLENLVRRIEKLAILLESAGNNA